MGMGFDLEEVCKPFLGRECQPMLSEKLGISANKKLNKNFAELSNFKDTDEVTFSKENFRYSTVIMTYKGYQHCLISFKTSKNGTQYWRCRYWNRFKCNARVSFLNGKVVKSTLHNHAPHLEKIPLSTMGTSDTIVRYSLTRQKRLVLHYRGYEYTKKKEMNGRVQWYCRQTVR